MPSIGFGAENATLTVYVEKRPPLDEYLQFGEVRPLEPGEIEHINRHCGNGWRKLFNVYSKLLFALDPLVYSFQQQATSWQEYRNLLLLQQGADTALLFSKPVLDSRHTGIHLVAGRTWARACLSAEMLGRLHWLTPEFAMAAEYKLLVTPYFDYRQLNNEKIRYLVNLILELHSRKV